MSARRTTSVGKPESREYVRSLLSVNGASSNAVASGVLLSQRSPLAYSHQGPPPPIIMPTYHGFLWPGWPLCWLVGFRRVLTDRVAFITGSGRGIGRALALAFAAAGARVVIAARSEDEIHTVANEIGKAGGQAIPVSCDVTSALSVAAAVQETTQRFDPVDILVNNAGYVDSAPLTRVTEETWNRTIAVNLTGTFLCVREMLPSMINRKRGRIINIASTAAEIGYPYTAAYCAAKHGVLGLTRATALEVASKGITVNAICPGWVDTEMTARSVARIVRTTGRSASEARSALEAMNPQRRLIQPEEVADLAVWFAGDEAAGGTGQAYNVADGKGST